MSLVTDPRPCVSDLFDPTNVEHLKALRTLQDTGVWPKEFWEEMAAKNVRFSPLFQWHIAQKLADAYLKEKLG